MPSFYATGFYGAHPYPKFGRLRPAYYGAASEYVKSFDAIRSKKVYIFIDQTDGIPTFQKIQSVINMYLLAAWLLKPNPLFKINGKFQALIGARV